ncbi:MAG TPA: M20 family metallopeptidase [Candidatus Methanomethylicus sp.]|nr:M20 family metallopeptidase [Candidatus Methanomethylicus sp.]
MLTPDSAKKEVVKLTQELVRIKSVNPPGDELPAAEFLAGRLKQFGFETEVVTVAKNRANVIAVIKGTGEAPAIMFNGHLDVVPAGDLSAWSREPFCGDIADGKIWGRGSSDMKGGVAAMCVAAALLGASKPRLKGDLMVTAVSDEESNSIGARHYVEHNSLDNIGAVVIPESTNLDIVIAEKGTLWYELTTYGKTAHSTQPEIGVNAVEHMMQLLSAVKAKWEAIPYKSDKYLSPPTINIATISGGVKTNSIPDRCVATVDLRPVPSQGRAAVMAAIEAAVAETGRKVPKFKADVKVINERLPFATDPNERLVTLSQSILSRMLNRKMDLFGVNFFTDAAVFATKKSIPSIIMGPGEYDLRNNIYLGHQPNEYVKIENLEKAMEFYYELSKAMLL